MIYLPLAHIKQYSELILYIIIIQPLLSLFQNFKRRPQLLHIPLHFQPRFSNIKSYISQ